MPLGPLMVSRLTDSGSAARVQLSGKRTLLSHFGLLSRHEKNKEGELGRICVTFVEDRLLSTSDNLDNPRLVQIKAAREWCQGIQLPW